MNNLIYIKASPNDHFCITSGISEKDFLNGINKIPQSIILINDDFEASNSFNVHTKFPIITGHSQVKRYITRSHRNQVPAKWVDFKNLDGLDALSEDEIANLLYLAHMDFPRKRKFFCLKLGNDFVYLNDSNGFLRTYFYDFKEFSNILAIATKRHLKKYHSNKKFFARTLKVKDISTEVLCKLISLSTQGMVIAFDLSSEQQQKIQIPIFRIKPNQVKLVWESEKQMQLHANRLGTLIYDIKGKEWSLDLNEKRELDLNDIER